MENNNELTSDERQLLTKYREQKLDQIAREAAAKDQTEEPPIAIEEISPRMTSERRNKAWVEIQKVLREM